MDISKRATLSVPKSAFGIQSPVSSLVSDFTILTTKIQGEDKRAVLFDEPKIREEPIIEEKTLVQRGLNLKQTTLSSKHSPKAMRCLFGPVDDLDGSSHGGRFTNSCSELPNLLRRSKSDFGAIIASRKRSEMNEAGNTSNKKQMNHRNQCASTSSQEKEEQIEIILPPFPVTPKIVEKTKENIEPNPSLGETSPEFALAFTPIQPLQPSISSPLPVTPLGNNSKRREKKKMELSRRKSVTVNGWSPEIFRTSSTGSLRGSPNISAALPPRPPSVTLDMAARYDNDKAAHLSLPIISSANGLRYICPTTVSNLLSGSFDKKFCIIDCRFEYEYEGGHIKDAVNIKSEEEIERIFLRKPEEDIMLVFHCEFSSHRAPKLCSHLRKKDRELHKDTYPELFYPEMYVIKGGYKSFFEEFPEHCNPSEYVPMKAKEHKEKLKENFNLMHKSKVKRSWSTGCIGGSTYFRSTIQETESFTVQEISECNTTHTTPTVPHRNFEGPMLSADLLLVSDEIPSPQFHF